MMNDRFEEDPMVEATYIQISMGRKVRIDVILWVLDIVQKL